MTIDRLRRDRLLSLTRWIHRARDRVDAAPCFPHRARLGRAISVLEPLEPRWLLSGEAVSVNPFEPVEPLGGLMYVSRANRGRVDSPEQADAFTLHVRAGQTVSAVARPAD